VTGHLINGVALLNGVIPSNLRHGHGCRSNTFSCNCLSGRECSRTRGSNHTPTVCGHFRCLEAYGCLCLIISSLGRLEKKTVWSIQQTQHFIPPETVSSSHSSGFNLPNGSIRAYRLVLLMIYGWVCFIGFQVSSYILVSPIVRVGELVILND